MEKLIGLGTREGHLYDLRRLNTTLSENKEMKAILERLVDYFCSDKALFPQGTLESIYTDAEKLLKG